MRRREAYIGCRGVGGGGVGQGKGGVDGMAKLSWGWDWSWVLVNQSGASSTWRSQQQQPRSGGWCRGTDQGSHQ